MSTADNDPLQQRIVRYLRSNTQSGNKIRGRGLPDRVAKKLNSNRIDVLRELQTLWQSGALICDGWIAQDGPQGMVSVNLPEPLSATALAWYEQLQQAGQSIDGDAIEALQPMGNGLAGMEPPDMRRLLNGLLSLRRDQAGLLGMPRFEVSARYLLGSSKLLDALPTQALQQFGIDISAFPVFPGYVMVAGPSQPEAVILVENPHSFETAVAATAAAPVAWVCTYGYGLSMKHSQHGEQLAAIIDSHQAPKTLIRSGRPPDWEVLLRHPRLRFWGDLDLAGLDIFQRLRRHLPGLTLSALYQPMRDALLQGDGHPYCKAVGKPEQQPVSDSEDIAALSSVCRRQAVDQEMVTAEQITRLWDGILVT